MATATTSRRAFLATAGAPLLAGAGFGCIPEDPAPEPSLAVHAANRLTFGATAAQIAEIESVGLTAWVDAQLAPGLIDDSACDAALAGLDLSSYNETWAQLYDRRSAAWPIPTVPLEHTRDATWTRLLASRRQLYEKAVNFWHEHFSIQGNQFIIRSLFPKWDQTIRAHALGNFRQLLEATAAHPCMLYYLDNYVNRSGGPNENYARELYELHALGVMNYRPDITDALFCNAQNDADGDGMRDYYIDNDVYESARAFTGWTFEQAGDAANRGEFIYQNANHDRFNKFVLCQILPEGLPSMEDGRRVMNILAQHPGTARHIATKLCRRFVSDDPPAGLVASTAEVFRTNWEAPNQIALTIRHILLSPEFAAARMTKFKRPLEWTTSAMRALGIPYQQWSNFSLTWVFDAMGHPMFGWGPPDGPPDVMSQWATSNGMLRRWNFVYTTASGWWNSSGFNFPADGIMPAEVRTANDVADFWIARLVGRPVSGATREGLVRFVARGRSATAPLPASDLNGRIQYLAALCTMTPEFMRM